MKKTTVEISDRHAEDMRRCVYFEGRSMKEIFARALDLYFQKMEEADGYTEWVEKDNALRIEKWVTGMKKAGLA